MQLDFAGVSLLSCSSPMQAKPNASWSLPADCLWAVPISSFSDLRPLFSQANLPGLQASLKAPDLWAETDLLCRLIYKNNNQHRGTLYMRKLRAVARHLALLRELSLSQGFADLEAMTQLTSAASATPSKGRSNVRVASQEAAVCVLQRLQGAGALAPEIIRNALDAAEQLAGQAAKSFFMPFCLTALSMLARIQVMVGHYILSCCTAYNRLAGLLPLLPVAALPNTAAAQHHSQHIAQLPSMLQCAWQGPLPFLKPLSDGGGTAGSGVAVPGSTGGGWVAVQAAKLWDDLGIMQGLEPVHVAPHLLKPEGLATATTAAVTATTTVAAAAAGGGITSATVLATTTATAAAASFKDTKQSLTGGAAAAKTRSGRKPPAGTAPAQAQAATAMGGPAKALSFLDRLKQGPPGAAGGVLQAPVLQAKPPPSITKATGPGGGASAAAAAAPISGAPRASAEPIGAGTQAAAPVYRVMSGFSLGFKQKATPPPADGPVPPAQQSGSTAAVQQPAGDVQQGDLREPEPPAALVQQQQGLAQQPAPGVIASNAIDSPVQTSPAQEAGAGTSPAGQQQQQQSRPLLQQAEQQRRKKQKVAGAGNQAGAGQAAGVPAVAGSSRGVTTGVASGGRKAWEDLLDPSSAPSPGKAVGMQLDGTPVSAGRGKKGGAGAKGGNTGGKAQGQQSGGGAVAAKTQDLFNMLLGGGT